MEICLVNYVLPIFEGQVEQDGQTGQTGQFLLQKIVNRNADVPPACGCTQPLMMEAL
ncbi:MAG: hypothetical protein LBP59_13105 [Planctomycetaceae bacterium]|nr:hypothetical protein [Planctomycetaceae bacterium]